MEMDELLTRVKNALRMDDYQDDVVKELIQQVKDDMIDMGVKANVVNDSISVGAITKGVWDLDNLHEYSNDFEKRVIRLREKSEV